MYRHEFVEAVAQAANVDKRTVAKVVDATLEKLVELFVKGEGVRFANFGGTVKLFKGGCCWRDYDLS